MSNYVSNISVVYGSTEPSNAIKDINGNGDDINKDFGGNYVWLVSEYTTDYNNACNRFEIVIQDSSDSNYDDLAKGAGGDYRYILPLCDRGNTEKITSVDLLRSSSAVSNPPNGYAGMTKDINEGRGKSYLYVIWKTTSVYPDPPAYVSGYSVTYGSKLSDEPRGAITELYDKGDDINKDFGGKFVWVVPQYNTWSADACTWFQTIVQDDDDSNFSDLAKGAGGSYRYLLPFVDQGNQKKIFNLRLLRSNDALYNPPEGYDGITENINRNRSTAFLYIVWQSWEVPILSQWISGINVVYGSMISQEPKNAVVELTSGGDDINKDFGGSFVWIAPTYTTDINNACTDMILAIQGDGDSSHQDLAKGAGGDYRYVLPICNLGARNKITQFRLLRSKSAVSSIPTGYDGMTGDINVNRGKSYLYLIWKAVPAPVPTFVSGIDVIYGDKLSQEPRGALTEIHNAGDDINKDFGGSFVWIVPSFNADARKGVTNFEIRVQDSSDSSYKDLAKGAGGKYRYCVPLVDPKISVKVSGVRLLRSNSAVSSPPSGYNRISTDINKDRGKTYLYIIWQETVLPSKPGSTPGTFDIPANSPLNIRCMSNLNMLHRILVDIPGLSQLVFSGKGLNTWMKCSEKEMVSIQASTKDRKDVKVTVQHSNDDGKTYVNSELSTALIVPHQGDNLRYISFGSECNNDASYNDSYFVAVAFLPDPSLGSPKVSTRKKRSSNKLHLHAKVYFKKDESSPQIGGEIYVDFDMDDSSHSEFSFPGTVGQTVDSGAKGTAHITDEKGPIWNYVNIRVKLEGFSREGMENAVLVLNTSISYYWWKPTGSPGSTDWTGTLTGTTWILSSVTP